MQVRCIVPPDMRKKSQQLPRIGAGVSLPPTLWEQVDALASANGLSRSRVIEAVMTHHLAAGLSFRFSEASVEVIG